MRNLKYFQILILEADLLNNMIKWYNMKKWNWNMKIWNKYEIMKKYNKYKYEKNMKLKIWKMK